MDKFELKELLKAQTEPMAQAVEKKLAYLRSDEVFTDEEFQQNSQNDNSLLDAFSEATATPYIHQYQQPTAKEIASNARNGMFARQIENEDFEQNIEKHNQNIAAKIAALRGISMPGDYLRNKK